MGPDQAVKTLEHTMTNGWQGIYEPDESDQPAKPGNATPEHELHELEKKTAQLMRGME